MEEISSLDSFQTDEAESSIVEEHTVTETVSEKKTATAKEDYDQVSLETFEEDENSTATSGGVAQPLETEPVEETEPEEHETSIVSNAETGYEVHQATDFEEVDAHVATINTSATDETDMLGDADLTLGNENIERIIEGENEEEMEVEHLSDEVEKKREDAGTPVDAEMTSNNSSPSSDAEKHKSQADTTPQDESLEEFEQDGNTSRDIPDGVADSDKVEGEEHLQQEGTTLERSDKSVDDVEHEDDEDEADAEDEPVENVQEPEESDVCLIPDDTETQMTEEEKEQAILARENADKADAETENTEFHAESLEKSTESTQDVETEENTSNEIMPETSDAEESKNAQTGGENEVTSRIAISWVMATEQKCQQCNDKRACKFRYVPSGTTDHYEYLCNQHCLNKFLTDNSEKYYMRRKKVLVEESATEEVAAEQKCFQCETTEKSKYFFKQDEEVYGICNDNCLEALNRAEPGKYQLKRHSIRVRNIGNTLALNTNTKAIEKSSESKTDIVVSRQPEEVKSASVERGASFVRRCAECLNTVKPDDKTLFWEIMDFCNEICLGKYQRKIGSNCQTCSGDVSHQSLGKYCVRFGFDVRQFCCASCLNEFKKGLKTCSCCQKDISAGGGGFLAPVGDKELFRDFCSQVCLRRYDNMCNTKKKIRTDNCAVCKHAKPIRVEILLDDKEVTFCSNPCFSAFKFVSHLVADQCGMCSKYFERKSSESFTIYTERPAKLFCSRICMNVYIAVNRCIASCQWCKVKKYNFDMIYKKKDRQEVLMCSLNCLILFDASINAYSRTVIKCDNCNTSVTPQYHLTMSDASMRNFCTYQCVMQFQSQFTRAPLKLDNENVSSKTQRSIALQREGAPFPTGLPKRIKPKMSQPSSLQVNCNWHY